MSNSKPKPWCPPAPSDHPEAADRPWPPNIPTAGELAPPKGSKGNEPYCGNLVQNAYGDKYFRKLEASQPNFQGNWWLLATLLRFEEAVRGDDRPDRFAWWNECLEQLHNREVRLDLRSSQMTGLNFDHLSLRHADLSHCEIRSATAHDAVLIGCRLHRLSMNGVRGDRTQFGLSQVDRALLINCQFTHASFVRIKEGYVSFHDCTLRHCDFGSAALNNSILKDTSFRGSKLHLAHITQLVLERADLSNVDGLFGPNRAFASSDINYRIQDHHTESARFHRPWIVCNDARGMAGWVVDILERHAANWEFLRAIGQLRLFGVSYLAVIAITSYTLLARWHNTRVVSSAHKAAARARQTGEDDMWATLLGSLPHLPTPAHLGYQLAATALLAIAATIYAWRCPNEVREATEVGWTRRMGQPLWEYRSAKWSRALARYLCLLCFLAGGSYTLYYLLARSWSAVVYLL